LCRFLSQNWPKSHCFATRPGGWSARYAKAHFNRPFNSGVAKLSKIEAARRQLDCVIRLYFDNDDLPAVHAIVTSLGVHLA